MFNVGKRGCFNCSQYRDNTWRFTLPHYSVHVNRLQPLNYAIQEAVHLWIGPIFKIEHDKG